MTEAEFDKIMAMGLAQAKTDDSWNGDCKMSYIMNITQQEIRDTGITVEVTKDNFNKETLEAFKEVEEMKKDLFSVKTYDCFLDILKENEAESIE